MATGEEQETERVAREARRDEADTAFVSATRPAPRGRASSRDGAAWLGIAAIVVFIGAGMRFAFDLERAGSPWFWVYAIVPSAVVAVVAVARAARDGEVAELIQPAWGDATRGLLSAAILFGVAVGAVRVVAPAGSPRESWLARIYLQLGDPAWLRVHAGLMAGVLLVAAAAEEIVWRGLVTRLIAEKVGSQRAWVWAAVPYALAHVPTAWTLRDPTAGLNPVLVAGALGLGLVWGGIARSSRRLFPAILSHAAFDWCVVMMFRLWGNGM